MIIENEFLTVTQAAELLGISRVMVHKLIQSRDLNANKVGPRAFLLWRQDVENLKARRALR